MCSSAFSCPTSSRENCQSRVQRYKDQARYALEPLEFTDDTDEHQTLKHTVLLILLLCSMFVVRYITLLLTKLNFTFKIRLNFSFTFC